jgi:aminopeptidase YwaD
VVCITGRCPELAGGQSPFPLIEDGDFELPSVYLTEEEGARLLARRSGRDARGSILRLSLDSRRIPSRGCNVVARRPGAGSQRAVVFAHIDAKPGTPGALDNGTGVAVLLVLADRLAARRRPGTAGGLGVELVALNGEDHYSAAGQMLYLQANAGRFSEIVLGMNVDVAGCVGSQPAYCLFGGEGRLEREARRVLGREAGFPESEPWVQGDHMLFVMNGVPAVAVTSSNAVELFTSVTHTPEDRIERADPAAVAAVAAAFERLIAAAAGSGC